MKKFIKLICAIAATAMLLCFSCFAATPMDNLSACAVNGVHYSMSIVRLTLCEVAFVNDDGTATLNDLRDGNLYCIYDDGVKVGDKVIVAIEDNETPGYVEDDCILGFWVF